MIKISCNTKWGFIAAMSFNCYLSMTKWSLHKSVLDPTVKVSQTKKYLPPTPPLWNCPSELCTRSTSKPRLSRKCSLISPFTFSSYCFFEFSNLISPRSLQQCRYQVAKSALNSRLLALVKAHAQHRSNR